MFSTSVLLDSHWYIGFPEKRLRSKAPDLTMVPLIDWQYLQDDGQWRDLKVVNTDPNILKTKPSLCTVVSWA